MHSRREIVPWVLNSHRKMDADLGFRSQIKHGAVQRMESKVVEAKHKMNMMNVNELTN
jgi:hypothetical protein